MKTATLVLIVFCLLLVSCAPLQTPAPTPVPTRTPVPSSTNTAIPTITATRTLPPRPSRTPSPTPTLPPDTPAFPNLGVKADDAVKGMSLLSTIDFVDIPDIEGQAAQRAEISKDFTTITLVGKPYLTGAEMQIDASKLGDIDVLNMYIISFLMATIPDGGFEAQEWARHSLSEAAKKGSVEKTFGETKIVIRVEDGRILNMTVLPAGSG